jgi:L-fuculose-phosphate aldolase
MGNVMEDLLAYSKKLSQKGFVVGPGGNTSVKIGKTLYIKPSGLSFEEMEVDDFVEVNIESGIVSPMQRRTQPSSEIALHRFIYQKRPEISCIFHLHPPITVGLSATNVEIRHMYPDSVVYLGKKILTLDYIVPTTEKIAKYVQDNIADNSTIILKNHGAITIGTNPKLAYLRMELLESLAQSIWVAITASNGKPVRYLTDREIDEIINLDAEKYRQKLIEPGK